MSRSRCLASGTFRLGCTLDFDGKKRQDRMTQIKEMCDPKSASVFIFRLDVNSNSPEW